MSNNLLSRSKKIKIVCINLFICIGLFIGPWRALGVVKTKGTKTGPTAESALSADQKLAKAMQENDMTEIVSMLDKDWAVITGRGGVAEGPSIFPEGIRTGYLIRNTFEISEPRVRLYGNIALVTTKVRLSGTFAGKPFEVKERQTDVWRWKDGAWKCILTHETMLTE